MPHSILPHQRAAFDSLIEVGSACFSISRDTLSISPRTNTLLVGPTGTGKSFLARQVASALDAPFWGISVSEWMPLGTSNKGAVYTWPSIFRFLVRNAKKPGVLIFLDELCKLGNQSWDQYVKVEVFRCLDLCISTELTEESDNSISNDDLKTAEEVLKTRTDLTPEKRT